MNFTHLPHEITTLEQLKSLFFNFDARYWDPGVTGHKTKITWRVCIPGTDLTQLDGYLKDGGPIGYIG